MLEGLMVNKASAFQINAISKISKIFISNNISNLEYEYFKFIGLRGKYDGIENSVISITFFYFNYSFNLSFYYDQLEFHILNKFEKEIEYGILEDFWDTDEEHIDWFMYYLVHDLIKLNIPYNTENYTFVYRLTKWEKFMLKLKKYFFALQSVLS